VRLLQTGIVQQRTLGEAVGLPSVLLNGARQARGAGEYGRAAELLEQSLSQHRDMVAQGRITAHDCGPVIQELAMVARERGDFARATALWEECLELYQSVGDRESSAVAFLGLSDIARDQGDALGIIARCDASLALFREYRHPWGVGYALNNLALAAYLQSDLSRALARAEESIALFQELQAGLSLSEVLITRGRIQQAQGYGELAGESLMQALHLALNEGPQWLLAAAMEALASAAVEGGGMDLGVQFIAAAAGMRGRMGAPVRPMDRLSIEQALTAARAALGEERYAALSSEAQAMSLAQLAATIARDAPFGQRAKVKG
jgi:tetratricopeptide (TPR) repeat protein